MSNLKTKFSDSFCWRVKLRAGRRHSLKHHAYRNTMLFELLGLLDFLAEKSALEYGNPAFRFVYASREGILKLCNKGPRAEGRHYTIDWLDEALAELRARHIISHYFRAFDGRLGFIVAPHDSMCYRDGNECVLHAPKRYECDDETAARLAVPDSENLLTKDAQMRGDWQGGKPGQQPNPKPGQQPGQQPSRQPSQLPSPKPGPESAQGSDNEMVAKSDSTNWHANWQPPVEPVSQPGEPKEPFGTGGGANSGSQESESEKQNQPQPQNPAVEENLQALTDQNSKPGSHEKAKASPETIGQHFAELSWEILSDGELDTGTKQSQQYMHWSKLERCAAEAIRQKESLPFAGRSTCAQLMGDTAKLLREKHELDAPQSWFAVVKELRRTPGEARIGGTIPQQAEVVNIPDPAYPAAALEIRPNVFEETAAAVGLPLAADSPLRGKAMHYVDAYYFLTGQGYYDLTLMREWLWAQMHP